MFRLYFLLVVSVFLVACSSEDDPLKLLKLHGNTMGTSYNISLVVEKNSSVDAKRLKEAVDNTLDLINDAMSTYKSDSEISTFNRSPVGSVTNISNITKVVLEESIRLNEFTFGAFDITVAPLVDLWGFGSVANQHGQSVSPAHVQAVIEHVGTDRVKLNANQLIKDIAVNIDLSAIAKGFAVDQVAKVLGAYNISRYLVEIGGEVVTRGKSIRNTSWVLGIESPDKLGRSVYTMAHLDEAALATSGDYRNYFEIDGKKFSHTIDPKTGWPVIHNLASVSVISESCMLSDGLATALMVMGEDKGFSFAQEHGIGALFIYRDGERLLTKHTTHFQRYLK